MNNLHARYVTGQCWGNSGLSDTVTGALAIDVGARYNAVSAK